MFWIGWSILLVGGAACTYVLLLPFGMASDGCHQGSTGYLCHGGDPLFAILPAVGFAAALGCSLLSAGLLAIVRPFGRRLAPSWGLVVGTAAWLLVPSPCGSWRRSDITARSVRKSRTTTTAW